MSIHLLQHSNFEASKLLINVPLQGSQVPVQPARSAWQPVTFFISTAVKFHRIWMKEACGQKLS